MSKISFLKSGNVLYKQETVYEVITYKGIGQGWVLSYLKDKGTDLTLKTFYGLHI